MSAWVVSISKLFPRGQIITNQSQSCHQSFSMSTLPVMIPNQCLELAAWQIYHYKRGKIRPTIKFQLNKDDYFCRTSAVWLLHKQWRSTSRPKTILQSPKWVMHNTAYPLDLSSHYLWKDMPVRMSNWDFKYATSLAYYDMSWKSAIERKFTTSKI